MSIVPVVLLFFTVLSAPLCRCQDVAAGPPSCIESERSALLAIRSGMHDPGDWLSSWTGQDCCKWKGVGCSNTTGRVVNLDLRSPSAQSPSKLNSSLLGLTHLRHLDLSMNDFSGVPIPDFIGSLVHLTYLNLSNAGFGGPVPHQLGNLSNLRFLDLSSGGSEYRLSSTNLHWLSRTPSLRHLDMSGVNLSLATDWLQDINMVPYLSVLRLPRALSNIPTSLPHLNLTSLVTLDLSECLPYTVAAIPQWLFNISTLVHLDISFCGLSGEIPSTIQNLGDLSYLDLSVNGITGEIPKSIGGLSKLVHMDLSRNQISGRIPDNIGNLSLLQVLNLASNMISGEIPDTIGKLTLLQVLDFSSNNLSGKIPNSIGNLSLLSKLCLNVNGINGEIPDTIGNLSNLRELFIGENKISGKLPETMGKLCKLNVMNTNDNAIGGEITGLVESLSLCAENKRSDDVADDSGLHLLSLGQNKLNGTIPRSFGQLSKLVTVDFSSNSLTGVLTEAHFANLTTLLFIEMSFNSLEIKVGEGWDPPFRAVAIFLCSCRLGPKFPTWLRNQTNLNQLCISEAGISDSVPTWIWEINFLMYFNASHNQMRGQLPHVISSPRQILQLDSNNFEGSIPEMSSSIQIVNLSNNSFSGPLPQNLDAYLSLQAFLVSDNHLNGSIPPSICKMPDLRDLRLHNNNLSGRFPRCRNKSSEPGSMSSFPTYLHSLYLRNNNLRGRFPSFLKHCGNLVVLDISENSLSGEIPTWIGENMLSLKVLVLRSNMFNGSVPPQLSHLSSLEVLDLADNNLLGSLPLSFGNFTAMMAIDKSESLLLNNVSTYYSENILLTIKGLELKYTRLLTIVTSIDVSGNNISGEIPEGLLNLHGLRSLNMSANNFSGKIPENVGAMLQMESLDLSRNDLSGKIPQSISALNFLSRLNLSHNHLSGSIPTGNQLQSLDDPSIYNGNPGLCGWPLQPCRTSDTPSQGLDKKSEEDEENNAERLEKIWTYAIAAVGFIVGFWGLIGTMVLKRAIRFAYFRCIDRVCDWAYVKLVVNFRRLKSIFTKTD